MEGSHLEGRGILASSRSLACYIWVFSISKGAQSKLSKMSINMATPLIPAHGLVQHAIKYLSGSDFPPHP